MRFSNSALIPILSSLLIITSCSKKPDVEYTPTYKMAGEWYAQFYDNGVVTKTFHKIITYNTADPNSSQIWVDDLNQQPFKAKFDVDIANLAFKPMASTPNMIGMGKTVKVVEGKVIPVAGRSKSGGAVDSIYLKLEFSEKPGIVYEIRGHQRTGLFEDEY